MGTNATTLWSLRPAGEHAGLRQAAQAAGRRLRVLSLQRLAERAAAHDLATALAAPVRLYTSPAAARFAARQADLRRPGVDIAVGTGTAAALRRVGVVDVVQPARMDSEGVLALPALHALGGVAVGLVTAPGGRGLLPQALVERGALLRRADVYERRPLRGGARTLAAWLDDPGAVLLASSAEALERLLTRLPSRVRRGAGALRERRIVVSSARLGALAAAAGFGAVRTAEGPSPAALVAAALTLPELQ